MKRRFFIAMLVNAAVVAGVSAWQGIFGRTRLKVENDWQIQVGMTQAQVEMLLGGPPGIYGRHAGRKVWMSLESNSAPPGSIEQKIWCNDEQRFELFFDSQGRVTKLHRRRGYSQHPPNAWFGDSSLPPGRVLSPPADSANLADCDGFAAASEPI